MKTWEDLQSASNKMEFTRDAISDFKCGRMYAEACTGYDYFRKRNTTILAYRKLLYKMSGEAVPDNFSANYKFCNGFFPIFVKQENSYLLGDGVTFNDDGTKDALGGNMFDKELYNAGEYALWGGASFLFFNLDHVEVFRATEFVPLFGEEDGALHAGIRFWQIADDKPLRATLYEEDGYTEYLWREGKGEILQAKRTYKLIERESVADGVEIIDGENYPSFPIVPLWANREHQSELIGLREKIDGYDLIQSGLANDLDDCSQIYWTITNAGGMDDVDLAKFIERMKVVKAAVVDEQGSTAEAHTVELPYQARQVGLQDLRDSLYRDAMALDTDKVQAGNVTATAIESAYEALELKCDGFEYCVTECINALLNLAGIEDSPSYHRRKTTNQPEITTMVLSAGDYLDDETILKHLPWLNIDEIDEILARKDKEEADRFGDMESMGGESGEGLEASEEGEIVDAAEDVKGTALNGAQTQSLILIMDKFSAGGLTEQQAINMIATAIGISKEDARKIVRGEE
jgi:hypothetical protein